MCAKNKNISTWREQAIIEWSRRSDLGEWPLIMLVNLVNSWLCLLTVTTRVISSSDLYCWLLPRCKALRTCRSGFPIATEPSTLDCILSWKLNIEIRSALKTYSRVKHVLRNQLFSHSCVISSLTDGLISLEKWYLPTTNPVFSCQLVTNATKFQSMDG